MAYLTLEQLGQVGFASFGENVLVSEHASIYGAERVSLGNNVRIDDFCILSAGDGGIRVGNHVHIAAYTSMIGAAKISLEDFAGLSSRVSVYSSNDDYTGSALTGPTVPDEFRKVDDRPVRIGRHVIVGSESVVLPGVTINDGAAVGALSLVRRDCEGFKIYSGNPARVIGSRKVDLLEAESRLRSALRP